jgi:aryl-alcohol dehydrogenase-like predicted oxidoreductase
MWQVSGTHGYIEPKQAIQSMLQYHTAGFTTWDLADIYGPAESYIGRFRDTLNQTQLAQHTALTKFVPNPGVMTKGVVSSAIQNSIQKMHATQLDLVQFHWWDYSDTNYLTALEHLTELKDQKLLKQIGLTNFDTDTMQVITDNGVKIVSNQVQYSIIDTRPQVRMEKFCMDNDIKLLAYGTIAGGLLSEKFLDAPEPHRGILDTASLQKYKNMIDVWGGWELFQELLHTLYNIAKKHSCSIPNVATRYTLDQPQVAGVIIGTRLSISEHIADNQRAYDVKLDSEDIAQIKKVQEKSQDLFKVIGDCGDEYR